MIIGCRFWYLLLSLTLLSSCTSTQPMLETVSNRAFSFTVGDSVPIQRRDVITAYQRFLDVANGDAMQVFAERRIADLKLDLGEQETIPDDAWRKAKGQAKIQNAVDRYTAYLKTYPNRLENDQIWYQLARAYSVIGAIDATLDALSNLVGFRPGSIYSEEALFRLGEGYFNKKDYATATKWYQRVLDKSHDSVYFERALYKLSWALFKQNEYQAAINYSIRLIDRQYQQGKINNIGLVDNLKISEQQLFNDMIYIAVLSFSKLDNSDAISHYFSTAGHREYEPMLYRKLALFYSSKNRYIDAANTNLAFIKHNPLDYLAVSFHSSVLDIYRRSNFKKMALNNVSQFVTQFGVGTVFFANLSQQQRSTVIPLLKKHIVYLATFYHARARETKISQDYLIAASWYREYLRSFPKSTQAVRYHFLLAEILFDGKMYASAITEYVKTAYDYPTHDRSAESAYASVLAYAELKKQLSIKNWNIKKSAAIDNSLRFIESFETHRHIASVLTRTTEQLYSIKEYKRAALLASRILDSKKIDNSAYRLSARSILSHSQFALGEYQKSESSYAIVLSQLSKTHPDYPTLLTQLAASIYKQAEIFRDKKAYATAAFHFLRVGKTVATAKIRIQSDYDAATMFILVQDWNRAAVILEQFRTRYPNDTKFKRGIIEKLALVYSKTGQGQKAANELLTLAKTGDKSFRKEMTWKAAQMYQHAKLDKKAIALYKNYVKRFPYPLDSAMDAREIIAHYYATTKNQKKNKYWLQQIIKRDKTAGSYRTIRTNYLAAKASLKLAHPTQRRYYRAKLTMPLKQSLAAKKRLMKNTISAYEKAMKYKISSVYTQATYEIAEVYHEFARSMLESQRPAGLNDEQLEAYAILMEEQAFPFEEKAIEIHLANIERTRSGVYDDGIKNSFKALEQLFPVRYIKREKVKSYVESIY